MLKVLVVKFFSLVWLSSSIFLEGSLFLFDFLRLVSFVRKVFVVRYSLFSYFFRGDFFLGFFFFKAGLEAVFCSVTLGFLRSRVRFDWLWFRIESWLSWMTLNCLSSLVFWGDSLSLWKFS